MNGPRLISLAERARRPRAWSAGPAVRSARQEKGWTQAELAARLGTTRTTVSRWEHGHNRPRFRQARALARALGRPITAFLGEPRLPGDTSRAWRLARASVRIARALAELTGTDGHEAGRNGVATAAEPVGPDPDDDGYRTAGATSAMNRSS